MNSTALAFDWNRIRAFLATAEEGSLSAAARKLGQTQPTVGRQISTLEEELGLALFERVGRGLILTHSGEELLVHVRDMAEAANRVSLSAAGQTQSIDGEITITASDVMAAWFLPGALETLRERAPLLKVNILASNEIQDLMRREADIAIRHVRPEQPDLIAKLVREEPAHLYASKSYLDRVGRPKSNKDVEKMEFIHFGDVDRVIEYLANLNLHLTHDNFRVGTESGVVGWELCLQGFGVVMMSEQVAAGSPDVEIVPSDMTPFKFPVWLVAHREVQSSRRIRMVYDILTESLAKPTWPTLKRPVRYSGPGA